jgi:hypothetical protein
MSYYNSNVELLHANLNSGTQKTAFGTTEVNINDVASMGVPPIIPAKYFYPNNANGVGRAIKVIGHGRMGATATPTFQLLVRLGATAGALTGPVILGSAAITAAAAANAPFKFEGIFSLKTIGNAGANSTGKGVGDWFCGMFSGATNYPAGLWGASTAPGDVTAIDWNVDNYVNVNAICSVSNAANTIQLDALELYGLN